MLKFFIILFSFCLASSCSFISDTNVTEDSVYGLYYRNCFDKNEYICLRRDSVYSYFSDNVLLSSGNWKYSKYSSSAIVFNNLNYALDENREIKLLGGYAIAILYSNAKDAVLLRAHVDNHFLDFIRIDSISCKME